LQGLWCIIINVVGEPRVLLQYDCKCLGSTGDVHRMRLPAAIYSFGYYFSDSIADCSKHRINSALTKTLAESNFFQRNIAQAMASRPFKFSLFQIFKCSTGYNTLHVVTPSLAVVKYCVVRISRYIQLMLILAGQFEV